MNEPLHVITCPYCKALLPLFKVKGTARCTACGGEMWLIYPRGDMGCYITESELRELRGKKG